MSFLQPWGLALAALAAVPVLLHLLRRETVQRVAFPALRYLRNAERRTARSMRFRDLLLLVSRVGLLVLLAVAAARPLVGRGGADDHALTDVVLLIDNSASTSRVVDGRTLLDRELELARSSLDLASDADRFWVVATDGPPLAAGVDAATARRMLDSIRGSDVGVDLPRAIDRATTAVPVEEGRVRELQLYSDMQATNFPGEAPDLSTWGRIAIAAVSVDAAENDFVADLRLEPAGAVVPGEPVVAAVRLARRGAPGSDTFEVRLLVDGATVAMGRAAPGSEALIPLPELEAGAHVLRAEIAPSGLRADDARVLGINAGEPPAVRLAGDAEGFLGSAVTTLAQEGRLEADGDDLIHIVEGATGGMPSGGRALVLVPPAALTRLPAFQQRLDALRVPWQLRGRTGTGSLGLEAPSEAPALGRVRIELAYGLERRAAPSTPDDAVLLRTNDGAPWLVRGRIGDRLYLLLASPLVPAATNLPVSAAMVPFVERLLLRWSRPTTAPRGSLEAGETVELPPRIDAVIDPDGNRHAAEGGAPWTPTRAGGWSWLLPGPTGSVEWHVGVNVPQLESDPRPLEAGELQRSLPGTEVAVAESATRWTDIVFGARRGAEATPWIVGVALLLGLLELLLAAPRGGRGPSAEDGQSSFSGHQSTASPASA